MAEVLNSEHLRTNPASSPQDCEFEVLTTLWLCLPRTVHKHKVKVSILCRFLYGEILLYVSECKLWSDSVQKSVNIINWMICDLQAIAPLTDAAKRIQEAEESGKTLLEVCLIHMHYWPNMRSICLDVGQVFFFFLHFWGARLSQCHLKMQKRAGQYRQEYQIQTCFAVCIKAVNFRLQLFWIFFWPYWKFFHT